VNKTAPRHLATGVLVIGAGGAGMYAAIEAAQRGAEVLIVDRSLIGRGGATVMAQMTVAGAPGGADIDRHIADTLAAGRELCNPRLVELLCRDAPEVIREMDGWGVGWARQGDSLKLVDAPGHESSRCVYVEFLATGSAVSRTLRTRLIRDERIRRIGELVVLELLVADGQCGGALALHVPTGELVTIAARSVVLATGGLTRLYARNSASANMGGEGYALALRAGAELLDMEFVQFFPIGHLAPRLVGMDPIMWDAFRYKLGGRLLNGEGEEFVERYGETSGQYTLTRDQATYAIGKEVEAGRGSPHGGAWLSFTHCGEAALRAEFGPVIDRLARNGIDLTKQAVEVAPIAHYHMGGVRVDATMASRVPGLFAAGEAVGGANGANRLSGNAVTEALVFGRSAGRSAAARAATMDAAAWCQAAATSAATRFRGAARLPELNVSAGIAALQALMSTQAGPFRTGAKLADALERVRAMRTALGPSPPPIGRVHDAELLDWLDLDGMLQTAEAIVLPALLRVESRGAHQREDDPGMDPAWRVNQVLALDRETAENPAATLTVTRHEVAG
jgi:succinate dehydrogenase / fumarate reductase flavoprotein subunit